MRVVGVLDADRPALVQAILELAGDLRVGEVGQEGKSALSNTHDVLSFFGVAGVALRASVAWYQVQATDAVGTKSEVSVGV